MFSDMQIVLAWVGLLFLMLLFRVPFLLSANRSGPSHRVHHQHVLALERFHRRAWHRR
jgi:hypothetical protein